MTMGSGNEQNGTSLATRHGVVVVTLNYRLGAFGLLPMHDDAKAGRSTGNWAYLDQRSALRWVKAHVGAFGGDASRVLLFGQSAGATSVCVQLAMEGSARGKRRRRHSPWSCSLRSSVPGGSAQPGAAYSHRTQPTARSHSITAPRRHRSCKPGSGCGATSSPAGRFLR